MYASIHSGNIYCSQAWFWAHKMKDTASLRVRTTYGLEVPPLGQPQLLQHLALLWVSEDVCNSWQGLPVLLKSTLLQYFIIRDENFPRLSCLLHHQVGQNVKGALSIKSSMATDLCTVWKGPSRSSITALQGPRLEIFPCRWLIFC